MLTTRYRILEVSVHIVEVKCFHRNEIIFISLQKQALLRKFNKQMCIAKSNRSIIHYFDKNQQLMKQQLLVSYHNATERKWWQKILRIRTPYTDLKDRMIVSNTPDLQLADNTVQTAKYHLASFFFFNLFQQFTKPSNIYFLAIGILQMIPAITVSQGKPTMFLPLAIVVIVSMIKDFFEDWKRHKSDEKENNSEAEVLTQAGFLKKNWGSIRVGEIVKVKKDEYFPCDLLLMNHGKEAKMVYVQTKNLDGETNLKLRKVPQCLQFISKLDTDLSSLNFDVYYEKPNPFLTSFNGNVKLQQKKHPIQINNILLRGCSLKINSFAIGLCIYNGHESKIMLNGGQPHPKRSSLQNYLNSYFKYIFLFQILVTLFSSIAYGIIVAVNFNDLTYTGQTPNFFFNMISSWGSWFIDFSNLIPISLLVTVQLVRYGQAKLLQFDEKCKFQGKCAQVQTSSINQQLGQIEYILTDKTGTLTKNKMDFKCLYVNGITYGSYQPIVSGGSEGNNLNQSFSLNSEKNELNNSNSPFFTNNFVKPPSVDFPNYEKQKLIKQINEGNKEIDECLLHLSLCHNVMCEDNSYTSSSPDQIALACFAKYIGYEYVGKSDDNFMEVKSMGKFRSFKLIHVLQFSSQRKRMSVILQEKDKQELLLLCKGADEVILQRVQDSEKQIKKIQQTLSKYASQGLRTLVLSQKQLNKEHYLEWANRYEKATTQIGPQRMEHMYNLQSQLERDMRIIGATAIEDKLQDRVKETIKDLRRAGMKVWMLTGDKRETAISIGYSCGLIDENCQKITLDCQPEHAAILIQNVERMLHLVGTQKVTIVSGDLLRKIDDISLEKLSNLLQQSSSVICCRVSPKDKEWVTELVKKWGKTLAVGDGANDVNMINAADVGVGVRGIEGSQATRAADFVISEFQVLLRLVTFHGLNFYHRNSNVCIYIIYKNIILTIPLLAFGPLSIESATYIYEIWVFQFYNVMYTSAPIILFGLFDTIYNPQKAQRRYFEGQTCMYFNRRILVRTVITSILMSFVITLLVFFGSQLGLTTSGYMTYLGWQGMNVMAIVIIVVNIRIIIISNQITILSIILVLSGILSFYLVYLIVEIVFYNDVKNSLNHQLQTPIYWLLLLLSVFLIEGAQYGWLSWRELRYSQTQSSIAVSGIEIQMQDSQNNQQNQRQKQQKQGLNGGFAFSEDQKRSQKVNI